MTTGSEVFKGRIKDTFSPVIREKLAAFPSEEIGQIYVDDEKTHILEAIQKQIAAGADLIICTGGMSVDPDDCTRVPLWQPEQGLSATVHRCFRER
mgnify:FL=1